MSYWHRVHQYCFKQTNYWFSLHRGKAFATALIAAVGLAIAIWKADLDGPKTMLWTFAIWAGAWLFVYLCHLVAAPSRFDAERERTIDQLEEEISRRRKRSEAARSLIALYERGLVIGANPENLEHGPWMSKYSQWKSDVEKALSPLSEVELWMFKTIGDANLFGMPVGERDRFLMMFQELKDKRNKLRLIISRVLPKDDPLAAAMAGKEDETRPQSPFRVCDCYARNACWGYNERCGRPR